MVSGALLWWDRSCSASPWGRQLAARRSLWRIWLQSWESTSRRCKPNSHAGAFSPVDASHPTPMWASGGVGCFSQVLYSRYQCVWRVAATSCELLEDLQLLGVQAFGHPVQARYGRIVERAVRCRMLDQ